LRRRVRPRIGQALLDHAVYDHDSGQLLSGSFMDYDIPRAGDRRALKSGQTSRF
jgi:hypothetical protein